MTRATERANRKAWRHWRADILARDNFRCQLHQPGCTTIANHVDDRDEVAACEPCLNNRKN